MNRKRILILGGTAIQEPMIRLAKEQGHYVITCDNRPDNPAHVLADEYHDVSITDPEAVLQLARELHVDAVVNYILEAGIQSAAYVHEQMGLPTSPYASVRILSNKRLFRQFLADNGFAVPRLLTCSSVEEGVSRFADMIRDSRISFPVVVKPCDLWGSRGVTCVSDAASLSEALAYAFSNSRGSDVIIEEFVEPDGCPLEGDAFAVDGRLTTHVWGDVYPDAEAPNPITPVTYCYPSARPESQLKALDDELQRLMSLLGMRTNAYNIEARIGRNGKVYLMEVAPRNGSNATTEVTSFATGCDIMAGTLRAALGDPCFDLVDRPCRGFWSSYIVHTNQEGTYRGLWLDDDFRKNNFVRYTPFVKAGDKVHPYSGTNCSVGMLIARFNTREELDCWRGNLSSSFRVELD